MGIAEQYEENEQYEQAYEAYKKELHSRPSDIKIIERLAHLAMMLNKKDEAASYYSQILEKDLTNTLCYEQLMDIYVDTDRYKYYVYRGNLHSVEHKLEQAINDFRKALNHTDNEQEIVMTRFTLGNLYSQVGNNTKAIDELLKTIEYEKATEEVFTKLAQIYVEEDILTSAIDTLERSLKKFDTESNKENLARLYLRNNEPEKAKALTTNQLFKIKCMLECGEKEEAKRLLDETQHQYSKEPEYYALIAQYYFITKEYEKALDAVKTYNNLAPNSPLTYQMKALIYENTKDEYNEHLNWGKYNLVRGNKDVAINEFLTAYQIDGSDIELKNTLAMLLEETGDRNHAIEFWEKIADAEPSNKKALEKLADFRESIGDYRMQIEYLEKLYVLDKRNAVVVKQLAKAYEKIKNKPSSIEYYEKYIQLAPNADDTQIIRNKLQKLEHTDMQEDEGILDKIMKFFNK